MEESASISQGPKVGDKLVVEITDIAFGGEGVARSDGLVIFAPFVITGESASVEIIERKTDFARAKLLQILKPSADRVDPPCSHYGV